MMPVDIPCAEFDVGLITVDMSINVTYPNLKPHLHELAELIAKELDIDPRQVSRVYSKRLFHAYSVSTQ
jgi:2C-methyl-D-erythritol 2,4-cyclodiphosphate synthase